MKKLGFGAMRLPMMNGDSGKIDIEHLTEMVDLFLERGFTYFDTSYVYHGGESEKILKQVLVDRYREPAAFFPYFRRTARPTGDGLCGLLLAPCGQRGDV